MHETIELSAAGLSAEAWAEVVARLWYSDEAIVAVESSETGCVHLTLEPSRTADLEAIRRAAQSLVESVRRTHRVPVRTLWTSKAGWPSSAPDVLRDLEQRGDLRILSGGRVVATGPLQALLDALDRRFEALGLGAGARAFSCPSVIDWDTLARCGYVSEQPQNLSFVHRLPRSSDGYTRFSRQPSADSPEARPTGLLVTPAACLPLYPLLKGLDLGEGFAATLHARCLRNEDLHGASLARLGEFRMREIVFVGTPDWVVERRERMMAEVGELVDRLGLPGRLVLANDPFFVSTQMKKLFFQRMQELKWELISPVGPELAECAIASFNIHRDHFTRAFQIGASSGELWSGCAAFGIERFAYALLTTWGPDPDRWPYEVLREGVDVDR